MAVDFRVLILLLQEYQNSFNRGMLTRIGDRLNHVENVDLKY